MGWEQRGGGSYYYRKTRKGKQVCSEYFGGSWVAKRSFEFDQNEQELRKAKRRNKQTERQAEAGIDRKLAAAENAVATITDSALHAAGFHKHKGQWRKKRHESKANAGKDDKPVARDQ